MKVLLTLVMFYMTPVYAAFNFENLLEDVASDIIDAALQNTDNSKHRESSQSYKTEGDNVSSNYQHWQETINENDKNILFFVQHDYINQEEEKEVRLIQDNCKIFLGKFGNLSQQYCDISQVITRVQSNQSNLSKLAPLVGAVKNSFKSINNCSSCDHSSTLSFMTKKNNELQLKIKLHESVRIDKQVSEYIYDASLILSEINEKKQVEIVKKEKAKHQQEMKAVQQVKSNKIKHVNDNISKVKAGPFNSPYKACLAEGEKLIAMTKLMNSKSITKEDEADTRKITKEYCGCIYVKIHTNSENASTRDRKNMAMDLTKIESRKLKDSQIELSPWEIKMFRDSLHNADVSGYVLMTAKFECS